MRGAYLAAAIVLALGVVLVAAACSGGERAFWSRIELGEVHPETLAPGTYRGEYEAGPVRVVVSVQVAAGRIESIEILDHQHLLGGRAERQIPARVVEAQSIQVDTVTRATASSAVILKAVEIALSAP